MKVDRFLTPEQAAEFLAVKAQTMAVWRIRGEGPLFHKIGRCIRYAQCDLEAWLDGRRYQNTAQADALSN